MPTGLLDFSSNLVATMLCDKCGICFPWLKFLLMKSFFLFYLSRIHNCLTQLYAKDITPDDKQELDEAVQREVWLF